MTDYNSRKSSLFENNPGTLGPQKREPLFNIPWVVMLVIVICLIAYIVPTYFFTADEKFKLTTHFGFIPYLFSNEFSVETLLSLVTYSFLHGNWEHIGFNMVWLAVFGPPLANRLGPVRFLVFWCFSAVGSALAYYIWQPYDVAVLIGASGSISGLMGASARYGFRRVGDYPGRNRSEYAGAVLPVKVALSMPQVVGLIGLWILSNLVIGLMNYIPGAEGSNTAWQAHIGGLLIGFFCIDLFDKRSRSIY